MIKHYYNEFDPYAAEWLRNLIAAGHLPAGDVDTRSIVDVRPADLAGYRQAHFFAGIGGWGLAARLAGWPDDRPLWTGSCPCQPFSVAGKGAGTDDPRHLWPHFFRLIRACRPPVVMGEQVAGAAGYGWLDGVVSDLASEGYAGRGVDIPACAVDAPHIRSWLYWVAEALDDAASARRAGDAGPEQMGAARDAARGSGLAGRGGDGECGAVDDTVRGRHVDQDETLRAGRGGAVVADGLNVADASLGGRREERADGRGIGAGDRAQGRAAGSGAGDLNLGMAHPDSGVGRGRPDEPQRRPEGRDADRRAGEVGRLGHADDAGSQGHARHGDDRAGWPGEAGPVAPAGGGDVADANSFRPQGREPDGENAGGRRPADEDRPHGTHWSDHVWLAGADGKARRAQPGLPLLAHGVPARVGRLRAYGNAIVPQVAAEVIGAFMEARP